jgi:gliding motility-associated-like protein
VGDSTIFTIGGTPSVEGSFNYTIITNGSCSSQSKLIGQINVGISSSLLNNNIQYVCKNSSILNIDYKIVGGAKPNTAGLPSGITTTFISSTGIFTISGASSIEGIYNYSVTTTGGCTITSTLTGKIVIGGGLDTTNGGGSNIQDICKNTTIVPIKYIIVGDSATVTGLPNGITGNLTSIGNPSVFTISGAGTLEGIFNYTVSTIGTCATPSNFTGTITVGGGLVILGGSNIQNICKNDVINPIKYNIVGDSATVTGLPNGITGNLTSVGNPSVFTISGAGTVEGIFNYTVSTIGSCITQSNFTGTITVGGGLVIPGGSNIQNICKGANITPIKYNIVGDSATVRGLPNGITGNLTSVGNPSVFTISGAGTVEGIFNYTVSTIGSCITPSNFTGTITVGGGLVIPGGSNIQNICKGANITPIKYNIVGDSATVTGLPSGITGNLTSIGNPSVFTISGTGILEGIFNYTVSTIGTCTTPSNFTGTISVGGGLDTTGGSNVQTRCINTQITPVKYIIIGDTADVSGLPGGVSGKMTTKVSPGIFTISGTPTISGIFAYTVFTNGSCGSHSSFTGTLTVNEAKISLTSAPGSDSQKICTKTSITNITYTISGTGTDATVAGLPQGLSSNFSGGVLTVSGIVTAPGGTYTVTVTPKGGCINKSALFTITVYQPIAAFATNVIHGHTPLLVNFTNTSNGANTYNWSFGNGNASSAYDTSITYREVKIYDVLLIASKNGQCPDTAKTSITAYNLDIPNVFSPNGDNINDVFQVGSSFGISNLDIEIINRWGTKIFESHSTDAGWDGVNITTGLPCPAGTYYYIIKGTDIEGKNYNQNGFVTLLR